ncbi:MAG: DMT family transporter [bacterium]
MTGGRSTSAGGTTPGPCSRTASSSSGSCGTATPAERRSAQRGTAALLAASFCIGAGTIAIREAYGLGAQPSSLLVVRFGIAGLLFALMLPWLVGQARGAISWKGVGLAALGGVILFTGARGEFEGLQWLPAAVLILLIFVSPIWVVLIERIVYGRRASVRTLGAIALVIAGITIMVGPLGGGLNLVGLLCGLAASITLAIFFVLIDRSQDEMPVSVALPVAIVAAGLAGTLADVSAWSTELGRDGALLYALLVGLAVWSWALFAIVGFRETDAVTVAVVGATEPVFVAVLALIFLGEGLGANELIGGAVVMAGVLAVSTAEPLKAAMAP